MIKKTLKVLLGVLFTLIATIVIAVYWPLPTIDVPEAHERILIKAVNIIDVESGLVVYNQDVLIVGNRIESIDSAQTDNVMAHTFVVDGAGKFLMPGLWNMHNHSTQYAKWLNHPMQIAHGVTGVRDMSGQLGQYDSYWAGTKERRAWNEQINSNLSVSPRSVLHSSYQIDGSSSVPDDFPAFFKLQNAEDVLPMLQYYKDDGTDFIKVYMNIPAASYRKLAIEAPKLGMHLAGHKPLNIELEESILLGQRSFEHGRIFMYDCFSGAAKLRDPANRGKGFKLPKEEMISTFDDEMAVRLMKLMRDYDAHWVPTLQTLKMGAYANDEAYRNSAYLKYIPTMRRVAMWNPDINRYADSSIVDPEEHIEMKYYRAAQRQVEMANAQGVAIMMGTDVTDTYVFPGYSAHVELVDLTRSGLSNLEALRAATITPAKYSGRDKEQGSVAVGKIADMIVLDNNPLDNIAHTQSINGVLLNGVYYDKDKLEALKEGTASLASTFHMNVKIMSSLLNSPLMRVQLAD
jgi:hypothetical protein